jgi:hypothetical protein
VSAFRTTEAGVCGHCGLPVDAGDLVVWINDGMVHLECEDPEKAIAVELLRVDAADAAMTDREALAVAYIDSQFPGIRGWLDGDAPIDALRHQPDYFLCAKAFTVADAILAAGFQRPGVVATQDELEGTIQEALASPDAGFLPWEEVVALAIRTRHDVRARVTP